MIIHGLGTAAEADISDFISSTAAAASITTTNITNWNSAFSWGDHSAAGYRLINHISSYVKTDTTNTIFTVSDSNSELLTELRATGAQIWNISNNGSIYYSTPNGAIGLGIYGPSLANRFDIVNWSSNNFFYLGYNAANNGQTLVFKTDGKLGYLTNSTTEFSINLEGTSSRLIGVTRRPQANSAGRNFTLQSGGATVGATNQNGGTLFLNAGISTGSGESGIKLQTAVAGTAGTGDRSPTNVAIEALGNKLAFNGATPITKPTVTGSRGGNAALASLITALAQLGLITDSTTA